MNCCYVPSTVLARGYRMNMPSWSSWLTITILPSGIILIIKTKKRNRHYFCTYMIITLQSRSIFYNSDLKELIKP